MKSANRLAYVWDFYKWQILGAAVVVVLGLFFLISSLFQKECALSVMLIDCGTEVSQQAMERELLQALQLDKRQYTVEMQNSLMFDNTEAGGYAMTSISRFLADIGSQKLDVCGMQESSFLEYSKAGTFLDLRECFTQEQLQTLSHAWVVAEDGSIIGLYADELPGMEKNGCYDSPDARGAVGIVYNTTRLDMAKAYLMYLAAVPE